MFESITSMYHHWCELKRITKIQMCLALFGVIFLIVVVPTAGVFNANESVERSTKKEMTSISAETPFFSGLSMMVNVSTMDPLAEVTKLKAKIDPMGAYRSPEPGLFLRTSRSVNLTFDKLKINVPAGETFVTVETNVNILEGDPNAYPFDEYLTDLKIYATSLNATGAREKVPVAVSLVGAIQAWKITAYIEDASGDVLITLHYKRSWTTRFFSIFVSSLMWILALSDITLATTLWFRDRKVEPPTIAMSSGLLFALPAVRNTQPGAPVIGCTADVVGFFWAMFIVGVATFLLILNYIVKYKKDKDPKLTKPSEIATKKTEQEMRQQLLDKAMTSPSGTGHSYGHGAGGAPLSTAATGGSAMTILTEPYQRQTSSLSPTSTVDIHPVSPVVVAAHNPRYPAPSMTSSSQIHLP